MSRPSEDDLIALFEIVYEREWDRAAEEADDRKKAILGSADEHATRMAVRAVVSAAATSEGAQAPINAAPINSKLIDAQGAVAVVASVIVDNYGRHRRIKWMTDADVPVGTNLYTHPAADAEDAARLDWLIDQIRMTDLLNTLPSWGGDREKIRAAIDAARAGEGREGES